jgi:Transposase and inactivated derivatives
MGEQRQRYTEEFKRQTVKFVQEQTKTIADIAQDLNIPSGTISQWMSKYRTFENEPIASMDKVRQLEQLLREKEREIMEKDRRIAHVEEELAIVKKAVHIFSKPKN